jgi:N-acetyl-1-D-myo-inositol-2-amino-2-deoxy-alpha-D-glucopyranoside deacetylase
VLVTYDPNGGYGHPDHIQAHRVAMRGSELAGDASFRPGLGPAHHVAKIYWNVIPRSVVEAGFAALRAAGKDSPFPGIASADDIPGVVDDAEVTAAVDGSAFAEAKAAAMRAHATQIAVDGPFFALSNDLGQPLPAVEYYRLVRGEPGPVDPATGWETDLFAGVSVGGRADAGNPSDSNNTAGASW